MVDHRRCQQPQAPVMVLVVVPMEEGATKIQAVFVGSEAVREFGAILHRFELTLRIGVVIAHIRPGKAFRDPQISKCRKATGFDVILGPRSEWMLS